MTNVKIGNSIKPANSRVGANLVKVQKFLILCNLSWYSKFENHIWKLHNPDQIRYTVAGCTYPDWAADRWCDDENNNAACNNFDGGACCNNDSPGWNDYCTDCECLQ